jgi:diacylglycerol kinase
LAVVAQVERQGVLVLKMDQLDRILFLAVLHLLVVVMELLNLVAEKMVVMVVLVGPLTEVLVVQERQAHQDKDTTAEPQ